MCNMQPSKRFNVWDIYKCYNINRKLQSTIVIHIYGVCAHDTMDMRPAQEHYIYHNYN